MKHPQYVIGALLAGLCLAPLRAEAQTGTIRGKVTDAAAGPPLAGATVSFGTRSAQTGPDGQFVITGVPAGTDSLRARLIGYLPAGRSVTVARGQTIDVDLVLTARAVNLAEIVVTGYGEQRAGNITGAVTQVSAADFNTGRVVSPEELIEFIGAADIYVTPYLNAEQIVSGTLAYAVGAGKAVVSTPYWYAEELLTEGRGMLVPFGDARAIAQAILHLLEDKGERHAMRKRAYTLGREMIWSEVARRYWESFSRAHEDRSRHPRPAFTAPTLDRRPRELPPLRLNHLRHLTDETGILQHSVFTVPNYAEGYCTDDNARALLVCVLLEEDRQDATFDVLLLASRYLGFLGYAFDGLSGRFRNFLKYDRRWQEGESSEDCHGRALWALGTVLGRSGDEGLRGVAGKLFEASLPATLEMTNPRAWAFTILGIHEYLKAFFGDRAAQNTGAVLAERLRDLHRRNHSSDWPWFESTLTYNNATLSHALLQASQWLSRPELAEAALDSLAWLTSVQRAPEGHFVPVGSPGWYPRGGPRARFDQQPLEAQATLSACLEAHRLTGEGKWRREAERCFEWFLGRNDLKAPLYNPTTGGCRDGLHPERVNQNQGAESTLSFLLSLLEMRLSETAFASVSKHDSFSA